MKKRFMMWLCKKLKVELVEPNTVVNLVHKTVSYKPIESSFSFSDFDLRTLGKAKLSKIASKEVKRDLMDKIFEDGDYFETFSIEDPIRRGGVTKVRMYIGKIDN